MDIVYSDAVSLEKGLEIAEEWKAKWGDGYVYNEDNTFHISTDELPVESSPISIDRHISVLRDAIFMERSYRELLSEMKLSEEQFKFFNLILYRIFKKGVDVGVEIAKAHYKRQQEAL